MALVFHSSGLRDARPKCAAALGGGGDSRVQGVGFQLSEAAWVKDLGFW